MTRDLSTDLEAHLASGEIHPVIFLEGEFTGGTVRLFSGSGQLNWDSKTWVGGGDMLEFSPISENADGTAEGMEVTLSGVPVALVSAAIQEVAHNLFGRLWVGAYDVVNNQIIADPAKAFVGRLSVPTLKDSGDTVTIKITYEAERIDQSRARNPRLTNEFQKILYPDDRGFEYVPSIQGTEIVWGR